MRNLAALTLGDLRNIRRDPLLSLLAFYPWIIALVLRWLIPFLAAGLASAPALQFDLQPYYGLLTSFFSTLLVPQLIGYMAGFLLLDERDDGTLTALRVTPLPLAGYLLQKLLLPVLLSALAVYIFVPVVDLVTVSYWPLLPIAGVAALTAPIFALLLAAFASNKVQGLAVMKGLSLLLVSPIAAYFVPSPWQWLFGFSPTFWPAKAFWQLIDGSPWWPTLLGGLLLNSLLLWWLLRRFQGALDQHGR